MALSAIMRFCYALHVSANQPISTKLRTRMLQT